MNAQKKAQKSICGIAMLLLVVMLVACSNNNEAHQENGTEVNHQNMNMGSTAHENMDMEHSSSGEVPDELKVAGDPAYSVGTKALIQANHMSGMLGAEGTVVGAYETIAYMVTYTPTTGEPKVEHHKWVIHEEIVDAGGKMLDPGSEVTLNASHMKGMEGATAVIESAEPTTMYMLDYVPTTGGEEVKNHKWVTEGELSAY